MTDEEIIETHEEPIETPKYEIPKPCDPATMTCEEMRDKILVLSTERAKYDNTIEKLKEIKTTITSPKLDEIFEDTLKKKQDIDSEIYSTFEKFTICTIPKPEEKKIE